MMHYMVLFRLHATFHRMGWAMGRRRRRRGAQHMRLPHPLFFFFFFFPTTPPTLSLPVGGVAGDIHDGGQRRKPERGGRQSSGYP